MANDNIEEEWHTIQASDSSSLNDVYYYNSKLKIASWNKPESMSHDDDTIVTDDKELSGANTRNIPIRRSRHRSLLEKKIDLNDNKRRVSFHQDLSNNSTIDLNNDNDDDMHMNDYENDNNRIIRKRIANGIKIMLSQVCVAVYSILTKVECVLKQWQLLLNSRRVSKLACRMAGIITVISLFITIVHLR